MIAASVFDQALIEHDHCQVVVEVAFADGGLSKRYEDEKQPANRAYYEDPLCIWKHCNSYALVEANA